MKVQQRKTIIGFTPMELAGLISTLVVVGVGLGWVKADIRENQRTAENAIVIANNILEIHKTDVSEIKTQQKEGVSEVKDYIKEIVGLTRDDLKNDIDALRGAILSTRRHDTDL